MPYNNGVYTPDAAELSLPTHEENGLLCPELTVVGSKITHNNLISWMIPTPVVGAQPIPAWGIAYAALFRSIAGTWFLNSSNSILRSIDNRKTWTVVRSAQYDPYSGGNMIQLPTGRLMTSDYHSDDDGVTWVVNGFSANRAGFFRSPTTGTLISIQYPSYTSPTGITVVRSVNNGNNWSIITLPWTVANLYANFVWCSSTGIFFVGSDLGIYRSTDDGSSFTLVYSTGIVRSMIEWPNGNIWASRPGVGNYLPPVIVESLNSGVAWTDHVLDNTGTPVPFLSRYQNISFQKIIGDSVFSIMTGLVVANYYNAVFVMKINSDFSFNKIGGITAPGASLKSLGPKILAYQDYIPDWIKGIDYNGKFYITFPISYLNVGISEIDFVKTSSVILPEFFVSNLSSITSIVHNLDNAGCDGTVTAYAEHYNNVLNAWCSFADVPGAKTLLGSGTATFTTPISGLVCRAGEKIRLTYTAQSTDGIKAAPKFGPHAITFATDSVAPAAPVIGGIVSVIDGSSIGFAVDFNQPTGSHHVTLEYKVGTGAYTAWMDSTGTRECRTGLALGNVVQVRARSEDAVGNQSTWTESAQLVITGTLYIPVLQDSWTEAWDVPSNQWGAQW